MVEIFFRKNYDFFQPNWVIRHSSQVAASLLRNSRLHSRQWELVRGGLRRAVLLVVLTALLVLVFAAGAGDIENVVKDVNKRR